jgi:hypothetical protein
VIQIRHKRHLTAKTLLASGLIVFAACANLDVATKPDEVDAVKKIRSGEYELIAKTELAQLKKDADLGRSTGRYQIHREGFRTWRLDTATGSICLLLTSDDDWKKPETSAQGCHGS